MTGNLSSIGRVLLGPLQQRRSQGSMWPLALIAALSIAAGIAVAIVTHGKGHGVKGPIALVLCLWTLGGWAMFVMNVLHQNHPTFSRLVPRHRDRLQAALLIVWAALVVLTAIAASALGGPALAWSTSMAVMLLVLSASLRWPAIWMLGCFSPFFAQYLDDMAWVHVALGVASAAWVSFHGVIALAVAAAGTVFLRSLVRSGNAAHVARYQSRQRSNQRFQLRAAGIQPLIAADGMAGCGTRVGALAYNVWMRHVLARPAGRSPMARVQLALGPSAHWTTRVAGAMTTAAVCAVFVALFEFSPFAPSLSGALEGLSFGMVAGLLLPTLQSQARLHQTQREQALLMLLPGVRRRGALNRWLSGHLTLQFALSWIVALLLATLCDRVAMALLDVHARAVVGDGRGLIQAALIPLVILCWRPWARTPAPTQLNALLPYLLGLVLVAATWGLQRVSSLGYVELGALYALASLAWGAWRWRRMENEPSAFPIGRLAR